MFAQRGALLATSPALAAAHAEAGQEGESQQVAESEHHLVCLVRVADQVSSDNIDCGQLEAGSGVRAGQQRRLAALGGGLRGLQLPLLGSAGGQGLHGQVAAPHCTLSPDTGAIVSCHNTGCGPSS